VTIPPAVRAQYPWVGKRIAADGGMMHVLDEGPEDAPVLLCVHGNPTWSFYWRAMVRAFAGPYRVVVPDHVGCGLSDKPQRWPYRLDGHVRNLQTVISTLGLEDITYVVHDWGGAIAMGAATRDPGRAKRFVITNTAAFRSLRIPPSIATVKIPGFGALAVRGLNAFARAATVRAVERPLSAVARAGLVFPYASWADRIATLRFVQDIPLSSSHPSYATLAAIEDGLAQFADHPMLVLWGDADFCFTPHFRAEWEKRFPRAEVHHWADVGHYVMEDAPDRVIPLVEQFLARNPLARVA
jgi:haloalkane dehalogenase